MGGESRRETLPPLVRRRGKGPASVDAPFWDALRRNELCMQRCDTCGVWHWPPVWRCGTCGAWELGWPRVAMTGRIYAYAHTYHPFDPVMKEHIPFINVLVELPEAGGARLLGVLIGDATGLVEGSVVIGVVQPATTPEELPALRWRLATPGDST